MSEGAVALTLEPEGVSLGRADDQSLRRRWAASPSALIGLILVLLVFVTALISLVWTPYPPLAVDPAHNLSGMSSSHLLGTDQYGRDVLSRVMSSAQITVYAGALAVFIAALIGIPAGLYAAWRGGAPGEAVLRLADLIYAFPALLAAITLSAAIGASTTTAMIAIGIAYTPVFIRVTRSNALLVLSSEYILAARSYGRRPLAIMRRHVLPNISATIIIQMTLLFSLAILAEAALDYLGLGTNPPTASWGNMLQDSQNYLNKDVMLSVWPGVAIFLTVLGSNLLGDGLGDVFDPRRKR
ncbi:ABC transporter permease [Leekyejoonella antrihumi]|uniref:ABC transporter permease n=1 Tax=Leekyejoonella antrihumi TaxID=1660198 RepID=A0A563E087_9MICO|nr:ABC transporter permease [Leekyejoonella antrihumi]TWP35789.1 ABC transporter permease [Leekyejoonella antrihumi]